MKVETAVILVLEIGSPERYACVVHVHVVQSVPEMVIIVLHVHVHVVCEKI